MQQYYWAHFPVTFESVDYFFALWDLAIDLQCLFWRESMWEEFELFHIKIIIKASSPHICKILSDEFGESIQLSTWEELPSDQIERFEDEIVQQGGRIRVSSLSGNMQSTLRGGIFETAYFNKRKQQGLM